MPKRKKKIKKRNPEPVVKRSSEEKLVLFFLSVLLLIALFVLFKFAVMALGINANAPSNTTVADTPASLYCEQQGYRDMTVNGTHFCVFPDRTECPASDFLNGTCAHPRNDCTLMPPPVNASHITPEELENGWYYGFCDQKKEGTPGNWLHMLEEAGGMWYRPTNDTGSRCDCFVYDLTA